MKNGFLTVLNLTQGYSLDIRLSGKYIMFATVDLVKPDYRHAEREAISLLNRAGVFEPPVNPLDIARDLSVQVNFVTFSGESEGVSGLYDPTANAIYVNEDDAGVRQTFTIAHELGHKVLHEDWARSEAYKVLWRDPRKQGKDRFEQEANAFAANLLMPRQMMNRYKQYPLEVIAKIFAVSEDAVRFRLQYLYGI